MKRLRQTIRALLVTLLLMAAVLPVGLYIVLSTPWAQEQLRGVACAQLTSLLGTPVEIGRVDYHPFNTISVTDITVRDSSGMAALAVGRVSARFELWHFLRTRRLVFDYAVLDAPELHVQRQAPGMPLNVQPILDRLKPRDTGRPPTHFDLKIGTVVVRAGRFTYDVMSAPDSSAVFNPQHIGVTDLSLHAYLRRAMPGHFDIDLERFSLKERSGLDLRSLTVDVMLTDSILAARDFSLRLPDSELTLVPLTIPLNGLSDIAGALKRCDVSLAPVRPVRIATSDLAWLSPRVAALDRVFSADFNIMASMDRVGISDIDISDSRGLKLRLKGRIDHPASAEDVRAEIMLQRLVSPARESAALVSRFNKAAAGYIERAGDLSAAGRIDADMRRADISLEALLGKGRIDIDGSVTTPDRYRSVNFDGRVTLADIPAGTILARTDLGNVSATAEGTGSAGHGDITASGTLAVSSLVWRGHDYNDITLTVSQDGGSTTADLVSAEPDAGFDLHAVADLKSHVKSLELQLDVKRFIPGRLGIKCPRNGLEASGSLAASLHGSNPDDIEGTVEFTGLRFADDTGDSLRINRLAVIADRSSEPESITVESDFLNGSIEGIINPSSLPAVVRDLASHVVPSLLTHDDNLHKRLDESGRHNIFHADFTLADAEDITRFMHLPVQIIYPVEIDVHVDSDKGSASLLLDAPYLQQGDKIIDSTVAGAYVSTSENRASVYATTHMPTKKGPMAVVLGVSGADSRFDTTIDWQIERKIPLNGRIDFSTALSRAESGGVCVDTQFNPGRINFGDDVWNIKQSGLRWCDKVLTVDGFALDAGKQRIEIDGVASASPDDIVTVKLDKINLISIFETLEIENAMIGGTATGTFTASQALSKVPVLTTDNLHVDNIGYNRCTLGDADITARWDNDRASFFLDADIINPQNQHSRIYGDIFPASESLDLNFEAEDVKVGFMQPFMAAFASDVQGYVSGRARLFGTFKNIDMEGDVFARDLKLKIDFTNTTYTATDSIHIRPGRIELKDITIADVNGHTAKLNGVLTHDYFHAPVFDFKVSDAHNFLSYNVTSKINPDWYGTVYGNGGARVKGRPGVIEIDVDMTTSAGSTFTFVLSDRLEADQYQFITFNDVTEYSEEEILRARDDVPAVVRDFQKRMMARAVDSPSNYIMDIKVDITPDARIILVMDPVGGDRIQAYGSGDLRMTYDAFENDLRMYGTYTLDRGSYNFTLQDIIIKDFTIEPGSSITFRGDPYSAQLDLEAVYQVNANLSDLDKSFTQDKDLNRTNVPVQALMKVTGDMRQPDLDFDLRFPTLTSDTYRKVRSIISTDDMMNRQIIYLLALNRFYTPDYMASTTKGNELFSVASSTISSQLSSMLGKLSDSWSIAPNLRSDRGDFSDVEVDVALSSRLLNNRLLFNGNFGYRDKSLNTNQFIGDFDIEYLLTPRGTWRLKAYNRYNDQNYYVRTATTTQGVGIMFRRDFDTVLPGIFSRKKRKADHKTPADTTTAPVDSINYPREGISEEKDKK